MLKKINELFDNEDLKGKYEIPYLKGELGNDVLKWDKFDLDDKVDTAEQVVRKVLFRYPILKKFNTREVTIKNEQKSKMYGYYGSSLSPASDGREYYAQIAFSYNIDSVFLGIVLKELNEMDEKRWVNRTFNFKKISDVYNMVDIFLDNCVKLNVLKPEHKSTINAN